MQLITVSMNSHQVSALQWLQGMMIRGRLPQWNALISHRLTITLTLNQTLALLARICRNRGSEGLEKRKQFRNQQDVIHAVGIPDHVKQVGVDTLMATNSDTMSDALHCRD